MLAHSMKNIQKYPKKDKGDMTIEVMKQALQALRFALHVGFDESSESQIKKGDKAVRQHQDAITALRTAIAEAEKQEPVAQIIALGQYEFPGLEWLSADHSFRAPIGTLLYTTPPAAHPTPDLLNALKRIVDEPNNTMSDGKALKEIIRIARAAIAKATGEQA